MSESFAASIVEEFRAIPEQYLTSTIQGIVYASQVLISLQLQNGRQQAPAVIVAANKLTNVLSNAIAINTLVDMVNLYNEPSGRNVFKLSLSAANLFDLPCTTFRIFADTVYDVITGEAVEVSQSLFTIGVPIGLFSLFIYSVSMPVMLTSAVFVGLYSYYNTAAVLYKKSEKIRYESFNLVSSQFFAWAVPKEESAIKAINSAAEINSGAMIFNSGYKLYCLEVKADYHTTSAGQYFCYDLIRGFALLSANNYAQAIVERIIVEKEAELKLSLTNNKTRLDLFHKTMYRLESLNPNELDHDKLGSHESDALQYWCYETDGKREIGHYTKLDNKAIGLAKKHVKATFAISEIQINRIQPEGREETNCLKIKVFLNDQYCDCECLENKGDNPFKAWCSDSEQQSLVGSTYDNHHVDADKDL